MTTTTMTTNTRPTDEAPESRKGLEAEAEVAKRRLLRTLERLDEKRHHAVETVTHVRHELVVAGVVGGILLGLVLGELRVRATRKKRSALAPYRARWVALQRVWSHPERLAAEDRSSSVNGGGIVMSVAVKAVTAVASLVLTRLAKALIVQRTPEAEARN